MPIPQASPPQKSNRHRWFIVGMLAIVLIGGILSFIFSSPAEKKKDEFADYQIVDVTIPPPPPPPPPEEDELEEPEEIEESIEPLEMAAAPESPTEESTEMDLGIDLGDLVSASGVGGFAMEIPKFGRGGGGGDGSDSLGGGDLDSPPTPVSKAQPIYPNSLLKRGVGGKVLITCTVDDTGRVISTSIKQSSGHPELDKAAVNAVNKWRFKPATKAGKPVKAVCVVPFNFEVKKN